MNRARAGVESQSYLQVAANFGANYLESLRFLSAALEFFYERPVFSAAGVERLSVQMLNLTIQDLHNLWSISGGKYLPSALYKLRMVTNRSLECHPLYFSYSHDSPTHNRVVNSATNGDE